MWASWSPLEEQTAVALATAFFALFFAFLGLILILPGRKKAVRLFAGKLARPHRALGAIYVCWLLFGLFLSTRIPVSGSKANPPLIASDLYLLLGFDIALGILGTALTLTAAFGFEKHHRRVVNDASGPLDQDATVTYDEMLEHSFYQGLNLAQVLFLWFLGTGSSGGSLPLALFALSCATLPWLGRGLFPVNPFSANFGSPDLIVRYLYKIKKWEYVFYKCALLHGLNVSVALPLAGTGGTTSLFELPLPAQRSWRLYWLGLNTSYTMEFFLQTLVKRRVLSQAGMFRMQYLLMGASAMMVLAVLPNIRLLPVLLSFLLTFLHRKHDFANTCLVALIVLVMDASDFTFLDRALG